MGKVPPNALARQLADALAAAFPPSAMSQSRLVQVPAKQEENSIADGTPEEEKSCTHTIPADLATHLPHPRLCPACTIDGYIKEIQDAQDELENRGGWSASKEKGSGHKRISRKAWRKAKVGMMNTIAKLEEVVASTDVHPDVVAAITPALKLFDAKKVQLGRVPGVEYVKGAEEGEPTAEHHEIAKLMMDLLKLVLDKEMELADNSFAADRAFAANFPGSYSVDSEQLAVLPSPPTTPKPNVPQSNHNLATPKSAMKRKSSTSSGPTTPSKRIRINDVVTVSPSHVIGAKPLNTAKHFLQGPFHGDEGLPPTSQPHSVHCFAEGKRHRTEFFRPGFRYRPGPWASQTFEEKVNTSRMKITWEAVKKEEEQDAKVRRELQQVKRLWMGMCLVKWWAQFVVPTLDLNSLKEAMEKSAR